MAGEQVKFKNAVSKADRARQFMPFMALKGYYDLCREKERQVAPRHTLTEEESLELSQIVSRLRKGDMVKVVYYDTDAYVPCQGILSEVVPELGFMRIVRKQIAFEDILTVERIK